MFFFYFCTTTKLYWAVFFFQISSGIAFFLVLSSSVFLSRSHQLFQVLLDSNLFLLYNQTILGSAIFLGFVKQCFLLYNLDLLGSIPFSSFIKQRFFSALSLCFIRLYIRGYCFLVLQLGFIRCNTLFLAYQISLFFCPLIGLCIIIFSIYNTLQLSRCQIYKNGFSVIYKKALCNFFFDMKYTLIVDHKETKISLRVKIIIIFNVTNYNLSSYLLELIIHDFRFEIDVK